MRTIATRGEETQEIVYNYFRTYEPSTGRYLESDPIGLDGGLNTYSNVSGDPLGHPDSNGVYVDSVRASCAQDPFFCAESLGHSLDAVQNRTGSQNRLYRETYLLGSPITGAR